MLQRLLCCRNLLELHHGDRDKARDRHRERDRDVDRDRKRDRDDRDRDWDWDWDCERERERERSKRSHTPDHIRSSRHQRSRTRTPDRHRTGSRSPGRHRRSRNHHRTPSPDLPRKRRKHGDEDRSSAVVSDFVDEIFREQQQQQQKKNNKDAPDGGGGDDMEMDSGEFEMMKMLGIPVGFDSTKGKPVAGNDVSGIRAVTKRQPRQYMNRRGGFNQPTNR